MASKNNIYIQHALNGGEKQIIINNQTYKVDGYCEKNNTVYEFYGCFWHSFPTCYRSNIINNKHKHDKKILLKNVK